MKGIPFIVILSTCATVAYIFAAASAFSSPRRVPVAVASPCVDATATPSAATAGFASAAGAAHRPLRTSLSATTVPSVANTDTAVVHVLMHRTNYVTDVEESSGQLPGMRSISCPVFSGPGYVKERHPSHTIEVPALEAPFKSPLHPRPRLEPVPPSAVRLIPSSAFARAFETNMRFLKLVDLDSLLLTWRLAAAPGKPWPKGTLRLMGWEHTGSELRGHFLGHWLSAASMSFSSTGDEELAAKLAMVVAALEECARLHGTGYLSAFPTSFLDRLEDISPVWAPYYTLHKSVRPRQKPCPGRLFTRLKAASSTSRPLSRLLAGLLNVARLEGDSMLAAAATSLGLATGLADYIDSRIQRLISAKSLDHHFATLNQECGGINDGLWQLAAMTGEPRHRALASLFDKPCLLGPLAAGRDELSGMHGNTALALVLGAATRSVVTGERPFAAVAGRFFDLVDGSRSYATGGSTLDELWGQPHQLGQSLVASAGGAKFTHVESCTTHNMVRLVEMLMRATAAGGARYADWIERALLNGVLGTLRGEEPGAYLYFMPLGTGVSKASPQSWRHTGWSTPFGDWWCCQGTGVEAFARIASMVFLQRPRSASTAGTQQNAEPAAAPAADSSPLSGVPELYVLQLISSTLVWTEGGLRLTLDARTPGAQHPADLCGWTLTVDAVADADRVSALVLRVPGWAAAPNLLLNGHALADADGLVQQPQNGSFVRIERRWRAGDVLTLRGAATLSLERLADSRPRYAQLYAALVGPVVLACVGCRDATMHGVSPLALASMLSPVPRSAYGQLRTLRRLVARGAAAGTVALGVDNRLYVREGALPAPPFRNRRNGATDVAIAATFRIHAGVQAGTQNLISFEPVARPGCYMAAPLPPPKRAGAAPDDGAATQLRLLCESAGKNLTAAEAAAASFRRHDPLVPSAHGSFQSYESVAWPGHFVTSFGSNASSPSARVRGTGHALGTGMALGAAGVSGLRALRLMKVPPKSGTNGGNQPPSPFALESSFEEATGEAELPPSAWWLRPAPPHDKGAVASALLYPLNEVVDETYSVYFDLS